MKVSKYLKNCEIKLIKPKMINESETAVLAARIADFKSDPEKLEQVCKFVDELLESAQQNVAIKKRKENESLVEEEKRPSGDTDSPGAKRRLGSRARGFMVRIFDVLCNCSQQAAAAARTHTESLRASKR